MEFTIQSFDIFRIRISSITLYISYIKMDVREFWGGSKSEVIVNETETEVIEEEDDIVVADPKDELIKPLQLYSRTYVAKESALESLLPFVLVRWPTHHSFNGSSREVLGLFEASLQANMKIHVDMYRRYKNRKINTVPPEDRQALQLARDEWRGIRGIIIKMVVEVARYAYGSNVQTFLETPKKAPSVSGENSSTKKSIASKKSAEKSVATITEDAETKAKDAGDYDAGFDASTIATKEQEEADDEGLIDTDDEAPKEGKKAHKFKGMISFHSFAICYLLFTS